MSLFNVQEGPMNQRQVMIAAPQINARSLNHLLPGKANSSTMTSEQAIYIKVPPAKHEKTISTIGGAYPSAIPKMMPKGVAQAKVKTSKNNFLKSSGKVLFKLIPRDIDAAHLCKQIAIKMLMTL
jgi:3-oxoacyl-[acyl-carrier-protein] synthase III